MLEKTLRKIEKIIPKKIYKMGQPIYHYLLAITGAMIYRFPSRKLKVIAITGTKGKTSSTEIVNAVLEEAGYKTALLGTLRFKIGKENKRNMYKMTIPGRFFVQKFLYEASKSKCDFAILEMTSEGAKQFRHSFIALDMLIFTNLTPEHIESHGSFEKYKKAKLSIAKALEKSWKRPRYSITNNDDAHGVSFLVREAEVKKPYSLLDIEIKEENEFGSTFVYENETIHTYLPGRFNLYNIMAGITAGSALGIKTETIKKAIEKISSIRGRLERVDEGQNFTVIVDYAHTADSLEKVYEVYKDNKKIAVLGGTGGGRDRAKRKIMGALADKYCYEVFVTNEDPYNEDPMQIINDVASGVTTKKPHIIMDRRLAIREAIKIAKEGDVVIISGKGTDPFIMEANGKRLPWDDAQVAREELKAIFK